MVIKLKVLFGNIRSLKLVLNYKKSLCIIFCVEILRYYILIYIYIYRYIYIYNIYIYVSKKK